MSTRQQSARRKRIRIALTLAGVVAVLVGLSLPSAISNLRRQNERLKIAKALQTLPRGLTESIEEDRATLSKQGNSFPAEVPLEELVAAGHLKAADFAGLKAIRTYVSLSADETTPNSVLIRVQHPDGFQTVLLSDGSIMALPRK